MFETQKQIFNLPNDCVTFPKGRKCVTGIVSRKKITPSHFPNPRTPESQVVLHSWSRQVLGREEDSTSPAAAAGNNQFTNNLETLFCSGVANFFFAPPRCAIIKLLNHNFRLFLGDSSTSPARFPAGGHYLVPAPGVCFGLIFHFAPFIPSSPSRANLPAGVEWPDFATAGCLNLQHMIWPVHWGTAGRSETMMV